MKIRYLEKLAWTTVLIVTCIQDIWCIFFVDLDVEMNPAIQTPD